MTNRKIGALWSKRTKEGQEYFSGVISDLRGEIQIVVFKNDRKESAIRTQGRGEVTEGALRIQQQVSSGGPESF